MTLFCKIFWSKFKICLCSTLPRRGWKTRNEKNRGVLGASIAISARSTSISRRVMQRRPTATVAAPANNDLAAIPSQLRSQAGLSALDFDWKHFILINILKNAVFLEPLYFESNFENYRSRPNQPSTISPAHLAPTPFHPSQPTPHSTLHTKSLKFSLPTLTTRLLPSSRMTGRFPPILVPLFPQYAIFLQYAATCTIYLRYWAIYFQYLCDTYETRNMIRAQIGKTICTERHWTQAVYAIFWDIYAIR